MTTARVVPGPVRGTVRAPPSKSYTHRALVAGAMTGRLHRILDPLDSVDTIATAEGLLPLGVGVDRGRTEWTVRPSSPRGSEVRCGASGTTLRFLLPVAARLDRTTRFTGDPVLLRRPIEPLLRFLRVAGARVSARSGSRRSISVAGPIHGSRAPVDGSESSQFVSGLLLSLPTLGSPSTMDLRGRTVSRPYIEATLRVLAHHGVTIHESTRAVRVPAPQPFRARTLRVPGDASSAAYLWAAAAVSAGRVRVGGLDPAWPQADLAILPILREMGASVVVRGPTVEVAGPIATPTEADLTASPDLLPLVSVLAAAVAGTSIWTGAAHATGKESNRRRESGRLARAMGATVRVSPRRFEVRGTARPTGMRFHAPADHRVVMSAAVGALGAAGPSSIAGAEHVAKSFPEFWATLSELGGEVVLLP
ncbi:MAG: 3-phosphoshikimate 1-carboxyvinyltransferase [Thermoplasmata archaeon]|nr:3-phosphoshikimate 1-carboxyvinyltransferase [Thermoplasmata archaeon]